MLELMWRKFLKNRANHQKDFNRLRTLLVRPFPSEKIITVFISALIVSYAICGLLVYVTIIVMDNKEARLLAKKNYATMNKFKNHVVKDMVSDEHTDEDHTDDLKLFEQKLMMHFNPQFMDEEHSDHQATESH